MTSFIFSGLFFTLALLPQAQAKAIQLALNWKAEPQFGGFYAAQLNGEFTKAGLTVEIIEGGSGTPTIQMLGSDKVDYAVVSGEEILIAQDRNSAHPVKSLFATYQTNPQGIMTHEERGFKTLEEVFSSEGNLALQAGLSYVPFLKNKYKTMKAQIVPYSGGIGPFLANQNYSQQCFVTSEPLAAEKAGRKVKTFLVAEAGFNPYTTVVATQATRIEKNPNEVNGFIQSVRRGWAAYLKDPQKVNAHMAKINKSMDLDTFAQSAKAQIVLIKTPDKIPLGTMEEGRWKTLIEQMQTLGLIKQKLSPQRVYHNIKE